MFDMTIETLKSLFNLSYMSDFPFTTSQLSIQRTIEVLIRQGLTLNTILKSMYVNFSYMFR